MSRHSVDTIAPFSAPSPSSFILLRALVLHMLVDLIMLQGFAAIRALIDLRH
jgi:hypothetical protein